ncbi:NUDIX domain-containing protein [Halosegnis longus]|uniref:NUDIX domain-containing protein n=1 Tax=Halosegnis longus TaxID=2216012 RepID=A0AAJ4R8C6_9EURY|nr:NUDIX domain-containing protein [Halosegnis longus]RNJ26551.1 NUDIX domain-containing protein [Salella cibi]
MVSHNADTVRSRLARLTDEYDPEVIEERETLDDDLFAELADYAADGYTGGGYAWVVRESPPDLSDSMPDAEDIAEPYPRVLLGYGRGDSAWGPTGGGREDGETYEEAAQREVFEETGTECSVTDCRRVRHLVSESETGEGTIHTLWVTFLAAETGGSIDVQESELNGAAWFHDLPDRLHPTVEDRPLSWDEWG